ncbi:hypothetical protein LZ31DRAFT_254643 [Colletotrichum somersetense]|nr:hypothetical protein LZ31DRAFT_254643 [Colletotrichum somersetense]
MSVWLYVCGKVLHGNTSTPYYLTARVPVRPPEPTNRQVLPWKHSCAICLASGLGLRLYVNHPDHLTATLRVCLEQFPPPPVLKLFLIARYYVICLVSYFAGFILVSAMGGAAAARLFLTQNSNGKTYNGEKPAKA